MGAAGTDTAIETADVALMDDDPRKIAELIHISRHTTHVLWQNITFAIAVKVVFFGLTFAGVASLWMAVLADMGASLVVIANGLRLLRRPSCPSERPMPSAQRDGPGRRLDRRRQPLAVGRLDRHVDAERRRAARPARAASGSPPRRATRRPPSGLSSAGLSPPSHEIRNGWAPPTRSPIDRQPPRQLAPVRATARHRERVADAVVPGRAQRGATVASMSAHPTANATRRVPRGGSVDTEAPSLDIGLARDPARSPRGRSARRATASALWVPTPGWAPPRTGATPVSPSTWAMPPSSDGTARTRWSIQCSTGRTLRALLAGLHHERRRHRRRVVDAELVERLDAEVGAVERGQQVTDRAMVVAVARAAPPCRRRRTGGPSPARTARPA